VKPRWVIEPLSSRHDRSGFDCGEASLNEYLQRYASQNARRQMGRTYVLISPGEPAVLGYYTISGGSVAFASMPVEETRRLPRYPVPVAHVGRLAVDRHYQGQGLGGLLLVDALRLSARVADSVGIYAVTVHALNERARRFYQRYGFAPLEDDPLHLYLPMKTIGKLRID
jgi:GNAT superfamily N-acetyltransferase